MDSSSLDRQQEAILGDGDEGRRRDELQISARLRRSFLESPYSSIRALRCEYQGGVAVLEGTVPSYYTRQLAQKLAQSVR